MGLMSVAFRKTVNIEIIYFLLDVFGVFVRAVGCVVSRTEVQLLTCF